MQPEEHFDVAVIGAGAFGAWTAYKLRCSGANVLLVDSYGPGNSRASSGGESRVIRMGYGPDEIYTRSAHQSLTLWRNLFQHAGVDLFKQTGVLWLAGENDTYSNHTLTTLKRTGIAFEELHRVDLEDRYPQFNFGRVTWGILETGSGVLMARSAVQAVVSEAIKHGVVYLQDQVLPPHKPFITLETAASRRLSADIFVFACGPWLPKLFPDLLGKLIKITRQEVVFFGVPPGDADFSPPAMPVWIDFNDLVYGVPDLDGRGFKLAIDAHGPVFDPETDDRVIVESGLAAARMQLTQRLPGLKNSPILETRVCQYENTSNGDFLIDKHPLAGNILLVGGGSGHGFKHGPAIGEYIAKLLAGDAKVEQRFSLATKAEIHNRAVF